MKRRYPLVLVAAFVGFLAVAWATDLGGEDGDAAPLVVRTSDVPGGDLPRDGSPLGGGSEILLAAGDIASCSNNNDEATAQILDGEPGTIILLGDLAYENGTASEFANCYGPTWGRHIARTNPSPGNHEYNTAGAAPYYAYFGAAAGDPTKGYYSFDLGQWHLISLNSNCAAVSCAAGSPQEQWLRADLAAHPNDCTLAYWHHPRFTSSSNHNNNPAMQPFWQALYDYRAELVLAGHAHNYETFAPQTPSGAADPIYGIRQLVVGTGGREHYTFDAPEANSEVRNSTSYGVMKLTLDPTSYTWEFLATAGDTFTDSGAGSCNAGNTYDADYDAVADTVDNCVGLANPLQENADGNLIDLPGKSYDDLTWANSDNLGDPCDTDDDNDGIDDPSEATPPCASASAATGALLRDSDNDRTLDGAECALGSDPASAASVPPAIVAPDADNDGAPDPLDPNDAALDSDGDGVRDGIELRYYSTSLSVTNTDGDLCSDAKEVASINADTTVNAIDLAQVAQSFGGSGSGNYYANFDTNKDGTINALDLSFVAQRFGAC